MSNVHEHHGDHDHDHDHGHGHGHGGHHHHGGTERALWWALVLNGVFLFVEAGAGWLTGSLALLSDAAHMVSDVAALALALLVARAARRPATASATFGLIRAEVLGAFINAMLLVVACVFIFKEAFERMGEPPEVAGLPVLIVGGAGLAINLGSAWFLWKTDSENINARAALAHMLADALGSLGAMLAAALTLGFGWYSADIYASVGIGLLVLWGAWRILWDSTRILLDFAPRGLDGARVRDALLEVPGVAAVHDLHVWGTQINKATVTAHVEPAAGALHPAVLCAAGSALKALGITHSTIQIDPVDVNCAQTECTLVASERLEPS